MKATIALYRPVIKLIYFAVSLSPCYISHLALVKRSDWFACIQKLKVVDGFVGSVHLAVMLVFTAHSGSNLTRLIGSWYYTV